MRNLFGAFSTEINVTHNRFFPATAPLSGILMSVRGCHRHSHSCCFSTCMPPHNREKTVPCHLLKEHADTGWRAFIAPWQPYSQLSCSAILGDVFVNSRVLPAALAIPYIKEIVHSYTSRIGCYHQEHLGFDEHITYHKNERRCATVMSMPPQAGAVIAPSQPHSQRSCSVVGGVIESVAAPYQGSCTGVRPTNLLLSARRSLTRFDGRSSVQTAQTR